MVNIIKEITKTRNLKSMKIDYGLSCFRDKLSFFSGFFGWG